MDTNNTMVTKTVTKVTVDGLTVVSPTTIHGGWASCKYRGLTETKNQV